MDFVTSAIALIESSFCPFGMYARPRFDKSNGADTAGSVDGGGCVGVDGGVGVGALGGVGVGILTGGVRITTLIPFFL